MSKVTWLQFFRLQTNFKSLSALLVAQSIMAPRCPVKIAGVVAGVPLTFADQLLIQTWLQAAKQKHVWKRACGAAQYDAESSKRSKKSIGDDDDDGGMEEGAEYEKGDLEVASEAL